MKHNKYNDILGYYKCTGLQQTRVWGIEGSSRAKKGFGFQHKTSNFVGLTSAWTWVCFTHYTDAICVHNHILGWSSVTQTSAWGIIAMLVVTLGFGKCGYAIIFDLSVIAWFSTECVNLLSHCVGESKMAEPALLIWSIKVKATVAGFGIGNQGRWLPPYILYFIYIVISSCLLFHYCMFSTQGSFTNILFKAKIHISLK